MTDDYKVEETIIVEDLDDTYDPTEYRTKRAKRLFEYVRGIRPVFDEIHPDERKAWLECSWAEKCFRSAEGDLKGTEFRLALSREHESELVAQGHNPRKVDVEIAWFDGRVTTEQAIDSMCYPIGRYSTTEEPRCTKCLENAMELSKEHEEFAMPPCFAGGIFEDHEQNARALHKSVQELVIVNELLEKRTASLEEIGRGIGNVINAVAGAIERDLKKQ